MSQIDLEDFIQGIVCPRCTLQYSDVNDHCFYMGVSICRFCLIKLSLVVREGGE